MAAALLSGCITSERPEITEEIPEKLSGSAPEPELLPLQQTRSIMNTEITVKVFAENESEGLRALKEAFEEVEKVEALMSPSKPESQLYILNSEGKVEAADPAFLYVLNHSRNYSELSGGAFDISIKPLLDLWAERFEPEGPKTPPEPEALNETLKLVNYTKIKIEGREVSLSPGMGIVLGGVAKGYAVDKAIEALKANGIENAFVNAGGDGRYIGLKRDELGKKKPWVTGLQNPEKGEDFITMINARDVAVATSGNYERYFNESARVSHIADPRTGYPAEELIGCTVIAQSAIEADALATTLFVLGETKGLELVESLEGVECLLIRNDRSLVYSSGFQEYELI
ncbi:MAG: FAD:protein FMN transferase [Methanosarcinaceae archaeon]|nr:FAD:protein FMN transferase [Methanosarcinaceae archaeon]